MLRKLFLSFLVFFLPMTFSFAQEQERRPFFEDRFEGRLKDGWRWHRENPKGYRFVRNTLEVLMEPFADRDVRNALLRPAPDRKSGTYQIELHIVTPTPFDNQYQQVGIFWTQNENVIFKFVREMIDGEIYIFPGKIPVKGSDTFLRLTVCGDSVIAEFKTEQGGEYLPAFEGKLPTQAENENIGVQCWHGPAKKEYWIKLKRFRIFKQELPGDGKK